MPNLQETKSSLIPNLAGIIKTEDLYKKMKFDYVPWAKTAQLLREHADGWMFHLQSNHTQTSSCDYVFQAPNGTGYLMGFYEHIDTQERGPLYPFAITDNANRPIKLDQISSTHIQNSHRRCLCACACFTFGLAYELWAQIEIQEANEPTPTPVKTEIARSPQKGANAKQVKPNSAVKEIVGDLTGRVAATPKASFTQAQSNQVKTFMAAHPDGWEGIVMAFNDEFDKTGDKISQSITTQEQITFILERITGYENLSR